MDPSRTFSRNDTLTTGSSESDGSTAPDSRALPMLPQPRPQDAPRSLHLLTKPTGAICNLDCTYCFFLSKEALYPGSKFRMDDDLLGQYIRQVIESQPQGYVTIAWQGGEPTLMGLDFFRRAVELVERYRRPDMTVEHTIQTNGTLLTPEWAEFFHEHGFLVGLSMDGPPDIHDAQRVDKGGAPTHAKVLAAATLLTEHGAEFNILCTVHTVNAIGIRSTTVVTPDHRLVTVPNSLAVDNLISNYSRLDNTHRLQVDLGLGTDVDLDHAREAIRAEVRKVDGVLPDKPVDVLFTDFGASTNTVRVRWWVSSYQERRHSIDKVNSAIVEVTNREGISMPYPIMTIDSHATSPPQDDSPKVAADDASGESD